MIDGDSRGFAGSTSFSNRPQAGIISKIRLENFMCHSSLVIEFGDWVNFITGQNGSGKSAILTALCVAFGSRAKGTQRATTLKDFIKTGCSYAVVNVEIKNQGEDAFKPDVYGDVIMVERRISDTTSSTVLKNCQGRKVAGRKEDLREIIEHFNIDVENPCVIMTQDKSREFLHSGNDKDKFKFFFKATLLCQVDELLKSIKSQLVDANQLVDELESLIRPIQKELNELQMKIKSMEHVEEISQQVQLLKKKLAWSWVYDTDRQLQEHRVKIETLKSRIPKCQAKIDRQIGKMEELRDLLTKKKTQIALMMERTAKVRRMKDELQQSLSLAAKERLELEENHHRKIDHVQKMVKQVKLLDQQIDHIHEQCIKSTQAEEFEIEERLKELHDQYDAANTTLSRLREEEEALSQTLFMRKEEVEKFAREIEENERRHREIFSQIHDLRLHQTNKVTAFGGFRVTNLLQTIERHHHRFKRPPIGPIGAHLSLVHGDMWAVAVENATGKLLNAFIVTDHKDSVFLRGCAREAGYNHLQIIIYDFARPRLNIPNHMLPQTKHPTTISVLHSDSPTILNVLVDLGSAERQVLVRNYDVGKSVAFDQKILNLKEVYTSDGYRMFSRGSAQTILPPNKRARTSRLCGSYDDQIKNLERDALNAKEQAEQARRRKRETEEGFQEHNNKFQSVKRRRMETERGVMQKKLELQDIKKLNVSEASPASASTVDELHHEISKIQVGIQEKEMMLEKSLIGMKEAENRANDLKASFENLCESALKSILVDLKNKLKVKAIHNQLEGSQKELNTHLSKYLKFLEKIFNPEISKACINVDFDTHIVNHIIASHFYHVGLFDVADCLINEAGEPEAISLKSRFLELHQILEATRNRNLEPALNWVSTQREKLKQVGSDLELKLHRLQFVEILQRQSQADALNYARTYLTPFASLHMDEVQKLMGCLLWAGKLERSPYSKLLSPSHWESFTEELTWQFCSLLGQSHKSPLSVAVDAGIEGLPTLLKLVNVMAVKKQEWQAMKQLPVPVDLGKEFQFHSIFVCPVSREQGSDENPPMLLPCGHVLCKQSIMKMSKSSTRPFKCPYCPVEATVTRCRQLYF